MSSANFDPQKLVHLAQLSRLDLDPQASAQLSAEIGVILGLIDTLQAVDTNGVLPLSHPLSVIDELALPLREDVAFNRDEREANMANAPQTEDGLFLVPRVIE